MPIDHNKMRNMFVRLVSGDGRDVIVRKTTMLLHDPVTGDTTTTVTDTPAIAAFPAMTDRNREGFSVGTFDRICFVTEKVEKDDVIVDGTEEWQAVEVDAYYPGNIEIGWKVAIVK